MYAADDTIVALATPPGRGGLAVVRLSGAHAVSVAERLIAGAARLEPRRATLVRVVGDGGNRGAPASAQQGYGAASRAPRHSDTRATAAPGAASGPGAAPATSWDVLDEAIATRFDGPASYTGEDVVEFSVHGSPVVVAEIVAAAVAAGARLARGGEFTLRAFLNGRLDLTRAEAVRDLVEATTPAQAKMALDQLQGTLAERIGEIERLLFELTAKLEASGDFPEEGYRFISPEETLGAVRAARGRMDALLAESRRGRLLREGITVAIAGRPNVGKSTLFNRLAGVERAIVTAVPGTTRDLITEAVMLSGVRMTLVDTAGVRWTTDPVEREGVLRAEKATAAADVVVVVLDASVPLTEADRDLLGATASRARVVAANKSDLPRVWEPGQLTELAPAAAGASEATGSRPPTAGEVTDHQAAARLFPPWQVASEGVVAVSAKSGAGIDELIGAIARACGVAGGGELPHISNARQIELLGRSTETLIMLEDKLVSGGADVPEELVLADVREASEHLQEVTGKRTTDDLLDAIFSTFCIGK
jgi:tRNA modification GTPase